ncbi:DUF4097 family beta strand repeat-containing protein [Streptomyces axinellae]
MPEFETPQPINVTLDLIAGTVRVVASERTTTTVEVRPADSDEPQDVRAVEQTEVSYADGTLRLKTARWRSLVSTSGSLAVHIELPAGSRLQATASLGDYTCEGRLGHCDLKTSVGAIRVAEAETVRLKTGHGDISVEEVTGTAETAEVTAAGRIHVGRFAGPARVRNRLGDTTIGEAAGSLRTNASSGRTSVDIAHAGVNAETAQGGIRIGEVAHGSAVLKTGDGDIEAGIPEGTAAWLDVRTRLGAVRNTLGAVDGPVEAEETVELHARTGLGDILVRRP